MSLWINLTVFLLSGSSHWSSPAINWKLESLKCCQCSSWTAGTWKCFFLLMDQSTLHEDCISQKVISQLFGVFTTKWNPVMWRYLWKKRKSYLTFRIYIVSDCIMTLHFVDRSMLPWWSLPKCLSIPISPWQLIVVYVLNPASVI